MDLEGALERLSTKDSATKALVDANGQDVLDIFELVFDHHAFTGRSGSMYGYEGLGSIYWHMVSKVLVAAEESFFRAQETGADPAELNTLATQYYRLREGMGFNKSGHLYGAFPADPYSHTPGHSGARQPGMTGQSKEDVLVRWSELGVFVEGGAIAFRPTLLRRREFLAEAEDWHFYDIDGRPKTLPLAAGMLGFTVCQTPVTYKLSMAPGITVRFADGSSVEINGDRLTEDIATKIFRRSGEVTLLEVNVPQTSITID